MNFNPIPLVEHEQVGTSQFIRIPVFTTVPAPGAIGGSNYWPGQRIYLPPYQEFLNSVITGIACYECTLDSLRITFADIKGNALIEDFPVFDLFVAANVLGAFSRVGKYTRQFDLKKVCLSNSYVVANDAVSIAPDVTFVQFGFYYKRL